MNRGPFMNWGHRGASGHAPENTILAFKTALTMGADGIECDIRESRDGKLVIFHDANFRRIAGKSSSINRLSLAEIQKIDVGNGERIPTLQALFEHTPQDFLLNLEMKDVRPENLINAIYRHNVQHRVLLSSFDSEVLRKVRSLDSAIRIGYLVDRKMGLPVFKKATAMKAQAIHFSKRLITEDKIAQVHREGFLVYAYTVDAPNQMSHFMKMGIDGLFTNYPDRLSRVRIKNDR